MIRFFRELRRREVFRSVGLYVGASWILIEAASILLPAFDWPIWILRALIVVAIIGFPIVAVLAWAYDITAAGVKRDVEAPDASVPSFGRKMDFVVIGLLSAALAFSVYLNLVSGPTNVGSLEPISVLIADFQIDTGDAVFEGLLEQALNIGIENAPHVAAYDRRAAEALAVELQGDAGLNAEVARLVAVREGVDMVLTGELQPRGSGFRLGLRAVDPLDGRLLFEADANADAREAILAAVAALADSVREALGDTTLNRGGTATSETFTATSIEAARAYMDGIEIAFEGRHAEAIERFRVATELDPDFGRAYSGWATSESFLGRNEEAAALWEKALSLMGRMTERERLRTLGLYYLAVTRNYEQGVATFAELVEKYPADGAARNNLAVAAFLTLDFEIASLQGERVLDLFPNSRLYRANAALYAMYAGDFDTAAAQARALIADDPDYGVAYLPLAVSLLARGDASGALGAYERMSSATTSSFSASQAMLGMADTLIYRGELEQAVSTLQAGIEQDMASDNPSAAAVKQVALAEVLAESGDAVRARAAVDEALSLSTQDSVRIAASLVLIELGDAEPAAEIGADLAAQLQAQSRAYGLMIGASIARRADAHVEAIDTLREALALADLWRIRYELGLSYLDAGFFAEAFDELETCLERRGEATALFLDDTPTFRYLAPLPYWLARAQEGLGMQAAAMENYAAFLALRSAGRLAADARERLQ